MSSYPDSWARPDLAGAAAAVAAAGGRVTASRERDGVTWIEYTLDGCACTLSARRPKRRDEWVALTFPWPAAWPDIALDAPGGPASDVYSDPDPPAGFALSSSDLAAARAIVDAGFAAAAREPRAELSIEHFDGAMITSGARVALNAETSRWLLGLWSLLRAAMPAPIASDDVTARPSPVAEDSPAALRGTRAEVLHRLLMSRRHGAAVGLDADPDATADIALVRALDGWIATAAGLAAESRSPDVDHVASRQAVRELVRCVEDEVQRAAMGGADDDLVHELRFVVAEARAWDQPAAARPAAAPVATDVEHGRRWWRRG